MLDYRTVFNNHREAVANSLDERYAQAETDKIGVLAGGQLALAWTAPSVTQGEDLGNPTTRARYAYLIAREIDRQAKMGMATETFTNTALDVASEILAFDVQLGLVDPEVYAKLRLAMYSVVVRKQG